MGIGLPHEIELNWGSSPTRTNNWLGYVVLIVTKAHPLNVICWYGVHTCTYMYVAKQEEVVLVTALNVYKILPYKHVDGI